MEQQLARLSEALTAAAQGVPIALSLPTLPLPPLFHSRSMQATCRASPIAGDRSCLCRVSRIPQEYPASQFGDPFWKIHRLQVASTSNPKLSAAFPTRSRMPPLLPATSLLLIANSTRRKGLITDLDDTLWAGILGEVGVDGVSWSLDQHTQMHALYQQFLASLASAGTLIAVASKNDPALVNEAFTRKDLLISKDSIFPFEVHWNRKSDSVRRILQDWNVSPDAVIFIDDSPMEVAEVKAAFPQMECIVFPKENFQGHLGFAQEAPQ